MRSKEEAFDYRYFPEPDIPAIEPTPRGSRSIRAALPELPRARRERYVAELGLKPEVARVLVADRASTRAVRANGRARRRPDGRRELGHAGPRGPAEQARRGRRRLPGHARHLADLIALVADDTVSGAGAKQALEEAVADRRRDRRDRRAPRAPAGLRRGRARRDRRRGARRATPTSSRSSARATRACSASWSGRS